ncbi:hypothetical protein ASF61_10665 [Duganella sp. Leaf126]|uniref:hypothetical protein n=1 Tax=Duganella sp. Leaf126 TaxID=1736266 RepID=UPI0006F7299F|nr:hypothetical protein [Duganella sp. Leaf126]KQQ33530.1 hypothetical protein ASF61_10665 [Duganella sp. Leaf126]
MIKRTLISLLMLSCSQAFAAELTAMETRWLTAGLPVITYAKQALRLPVDITVQPRAQADDVPVALGYQDGRCKLVLSLRGNPQAEDILGSVADAQRALMIEAMFAHEIAHCWRYAQGAWHQTPSGFSQNSAQPARALQDTRREEGFADLVALAWTQQRHPEHYADVAAWMRQVRAPSTAGVTSAAAAVAADEVAGGSHGTMAWLQLAPTGAVFDSRLSLFDQAGSVWRQGLARGE